MRALILKVPALAAAGALSLWAQATGTISGTVRDTSDAVVAEAKITATHVGTNLMRKADTDARGEFVLPLLPVGEYEVRVEKDGFSAFLQKGVLLQANTQVRVDAALALRTNITEVTVSAKPSLLQTASTTLVQVVESQRILDLPLNGRNVLELVSLNAGVSNTNVPVRYQGTNFGFGRYQPALSVAGTRGISGNYLLDNADLNESQTNLPNPFPNPDAVQEFSVQISTFDAQYGRAAGGVVNAVTKSGANQIHGSAFEFLRNFELNAANFFSGRDTLKQNQFGGSLGGPIRKDRTFLFGSYQGTRQRTSTPAALNIAPSQAMKDGNFSAWLQPNGQGTVLDALTNAPFPGNLIPTSRFDPVSTKILSLVPTSSNSLYQIRLATPVSKLRDDQMVLRTDHSLSQRHRLSVRYFMFDFNNLPLLKPDNLLFSSDGQSGTMHSLAAGSTYTISPAWLNAFNVAYTTQAPDRTTAGTPVVTPQQLGAQVKNVPGINLLDVAITGWSGISLGNNAHNESSSFQLGNITSYATGRHNLRFGVDIRRYRSFFQTFFLTDGQASFTGQIRSLAGRQNAGNAYAEFVLGTAASWTQRSANHLERESPEYALFFQEDIRLTSRLTANLGLRWDPKPAPREVGKQVTEFVAGRQSTSFPNAPRGLLFTGDQGVGATVIPSCWNLWAPRAGLAFQATPRTVLRAAYGIFYDELPGQVFNGTISSQPWGAVVTKTGPVQFSNPYAGETILDPVGYAPSKDMIFSPFATFTIQSRDMRPGYMQNWNVVAERQVFRSLLARAAYVGSKGTHLLNWVNVNPGIYGPGATPANVNQRRPYANIGPLNLGRSVADSSYHSLQLTLQQRYSHGLSLVANYTFSKSIDNTSFADGGGGNQAGPDPSNLRINRGLSDFDITHRLVVSGVWQMPLLKDRNTVLRSVLGGWQSNGIFTARTGSPLTIVSGADTNYDGVAGDFADYLGGEWRLGDGRSKAEKIAQWFDKRVFRSGAIGTIGTGRRAQLRGPGAWNVDYAIFKYLPIREKTRLQLRGEFFNLFNHANLGGPGTTVVGTGFGVISSASSPRIVQLALKLIF